MQGAREFKMPIFSVLFLHFHLTHKFDTISVKAAEPIADDLARINYLKMKKTTITDFALGCLIILLVLVASIIKWYPTEIVEHRTYDLRSMLSQKTVPSPVVIVTIDDESLKKIGSWPWPRAYIAHAINRLNDYGAKVMGINILYAEADRNPALKEIKNIIKKIETRKRATDRSKESPAERAKFIEIFAALKEAERKLDNDAILSSSLSSAGNAALPIFFLIDRGQPNNKSDLPDYLNKNSLQVPNAKMPATGRVIASDVISPVGYFSEHALALGHINHIPDRDGKVRSEPLFIPYGNRLYPSLALQLALKYLDYDLKDIALSNNRIKIGNISVPIDEHYKLRAKYNRDESFRRYSFFDIVNEKISPQLFKNRIVLLGCNVPGLASTFDTPVKEDMPDIMLMANIAENILNKDFITRPEWAFPLETGIIILFGIALCIILPRLNAGISMVIALILVLAWTGIAGYLFVSYGYWLKIAYPCILFVASCAVFALKRRLFKEEKITQAYIMENADLKLVVGSKTDNGLSRERNEDSLCIDPHTGLLCVADGLGGHASGEVASKMAVEKIKDFIKRSESGEEHFIQNYVKGYSETANILNSAVLSANKEIYKSAQDTPQWHGMGTTVSAALLKENRLSIAHVGDSRIYLVRAGYLEQLTDDHNMAYEQKRHPQAAKPSRSMKHVLTRAVGIGPDVEADLSELTLSDGDILILCTDGLYTMVPDSDLLSTVKSATDPYKACARLVSMANKNGGEDNITVIVAYIHKKS